ncbi:MAG: ABC transporter permease [Gammaproteobacteria bacterium]
MVRAIERLGRRTVAAVEELGYLSALLGESLYWLFLGKRRNQPVRLNSVFREAMLIGVRAIPIVAVLAFAVGVMLAIQGIETLKKFGAEGQVVVGIALSVTREFAPLIVGILVAGRSGSAIAARIGTMRESQEVDALQVMGINPIRFLAAPVLVAMLLTLPALTILADFMGLLGGGIFTAAETQGTLGVYFTQTFEVLSVDDVRQGLLKSLVFAVIITLVGISNGFQVTGGAEGVGHATTRAVVLSISGIVLADMLFTFLLNR